MIEQKPYRPSNGTEGDIFMGHWCEHCAFNALDEDGCDIQLTALAYGIDDPEYPGEWVYRASVPVCTAFQHMADADGSEPAIRCDKTPDMFGEAI